MRRISGTTSMIILAMVLVGCGSIGQMAATVAVVSPQIVEASRNLCSKGESVLRVASMVPLPSGGKEILVELNSYCGQMLAGKVPVTTDTNTPNWIEQNFMGLRALLG